MLMNKILVKLRYILVSCRPRQWFKNLALFGPAFLFGNLFTGAVFWRVLAGMVVFSFVSSAMYLFNDVQDREKDRAHPLKKRRPIASGQISPRLALGVSLFLTVLSFRWALSLSPYFFVMVLAYVLLQLTYSLFLRDVIIIDALVIALGFIFRVFAGALIVPISISSWLVLSVIGLSLLMAFGKRRSERTLLESHDGGFTTRAALRGYPDTLLDSTISTFSAFTILAYSLFAFETSPTAEVLPGVLPSILARPKWMMLTIPLVIYGVSRYLYVIYEKGEGESPDKVLLSDRPLLISIFLWVVSVGVIVYLMEP